MRKVLGRDAAVRLLVFGERFDAEAALRAGLVSCVTPEAESHGAALTMARGAAENVRPAVTASKGLLNAIDSGEYEARHWDEVRKKLLSSPERQAAIAKAKSRHGSS